MSGLQLLHKRGVQIAVPDSEDVRRCEAILRRGSRSFYAASRLLPQRIRRPTMVLYAFCRNVDDAVDMSEGTAAVSLRVVDELRERLGRAYAGRPMDSPVDRAFAIVAHQCSIPIAVPHALLDGMEWDARGRRYEDIEDLFEYAARVAGTVGVMMTLIMGSRQANVLGRACDLGAAMQLTNIARDIGEDAARGRIYLPLSWCRDAQIDPEAWLQNPTPSETLRQLVARLLTTADELYTRADSGVAELPADCRVAIRAARLIYSDIGRKIARAGYDSVTRRAYVSTTRKLWLVARAVFSGNRKVQATTAAELPSASFLVDAATSNELVCGSSS